MEKAKISYALDALLGVSFAVIAFTGALKFFGQANLLKGIGITQMALSQMHDNFGIIFILLALVHIFLHLDWIKAMTKAIFFKKKE